MQEQNTVIPLYTIHEPQDKTDLTEEHRAELDLSGQDLTDAFPWSKYKEVKILILTDAKVENLQFLDHLPNLQVLDLRRAKINNLTFNFLPFQLKELSISDLKIPSISFLKRLTQLEELNLTDSNILDDDFSSLACLQHLKILDLSGTNIQGKQANIIGELTDLRELYLAESRVIDITFVENLIYLEKLDLRDTRVKVQLFTSVLTKLKYLKELEVNDDLEKVRDAILEQIRLPSTKAINNQNDLPRKAEQLTIQLTPIPRLIDAGILTSINDKLKAMRQSGSPIISEPLNGGHSKNPAGPSTEKPFKEEILGNLKNYIQMS